MNIGVVDCGGANLNSIKYALKRINVDAEVSSNIDVLKTKDAFILPGVGSAGVVMSYLTDKKLDEFICNTNKLTLGICIGMHVLFDYSEEDNTNCLGLIKGKIKKFKSDSQPVPQMGWNYVDGIDEFTAISNHYYFANSYYSPIYDHTLAAADYSLPYSAAVKKNNFFGCQFHPEKSSQAGQKFLDYFFNSNEDITRY